MVDSSCMIVILSGRSDLEVEVVLYVHHGRFRFKSSCLTRRSVEHGTRALTVLG